MTDDVPFADLVKDTRIAGVFKRDKRVYPKVS
jgi:hypothetical protein